jgi:hypothetical protein
MKSVVLATSSGINHAVIEGLPSAADMRTYEQQARLATIADPRLRQEVSQFFSECYISARSKYQAEKPSLSAITELLDNYGPDDPDWLGSHVYRETPGYYDTFRASTPITGWAYAPARDTEYEVADPPEWGRPYCNEWWADDDIGLRQKLVAEADVTSGGLSGLIVTIAPFVAGEYQYDAVAKVVLTNAPPSWSNNDLVAYNSGSSGLFSYAEHFIKGGLATGRCYHGIGIVFSDHDRNSAGPAHGAGRSAAGHVRAVAAVRGVVAILAVDADDRGDGDLHGQVLERAVVPGVVGGSEPDSLNVSRCECFLSDICQSGRARFQANAAEHDHHEPVSGAAAVVERDDGLGGDSRGKSN